MDVDIAVLQDYGRGEMIGDGEARAGRTSGRPADWSRVGYGMQQRGEIPSCPPMHGVALDGDSGVLESGLTWERGFRSPVAEDTRYMAAAVRRLH